jgi:hypothetical protein
VVNWQDFGEREWLPWMRQTRNSMTHRSPSKRTNVIADDQLIWPFYKQPKWSELQSLVFGVGPKGSSLLDAYILRTSVDVLEGLCDSTAKLVTATTERMVGCWQARRADPAAIIQHGKQWPAVEPNRPPMNFPGYGNPRTVQGDSIITNDVDGIRWTAARLDDSRRNDWYS